MFRTLLIKSLDAVISCLEKKDEYAVNSLVCIPYDGDCWKKTMAERFGHDVVECLMDVYNDDASAIRFSWSKSTVPGDYFSRGICILLSPREVILAYDENLKIAKWAATSKGDGFEAIARDWPNWMPLFQFPNGDMFCISLNKDRGSVVFLEHDTMDSGINLHGILIAKNIRDLIAKWSAIGFVDIDWSLVCSDEGIDIECELITSQRDFPMQSVSDADRLKPPTEQP